MPPTTTTSERARKRATQSRLRAIYRAPHHDRTGMYVPGYYIVYNLRDHRRYVVVNQFDNWVCHCEGAKAKARCKHLQRVLDREEKRIRAEALANG